MKRIMLISDNPGTKTFQAILSLKHHIILKGGFISDIFFSTYNLNIRNQIAAKTDDHSIIVISLIKKNLQMIIQEPILMNILLNADHLSIYIFGAPSLCKYFDIGKNNIKYYNRAGVSKTSRKFKNEILERL